MSLRLSTGFCHGMQLQSPDEGTRPTSGKVRAAVWNSLQMHVSGARVLDVFAGSGAVGIEALSRGAHSACFVENSPEALKALRANLDEVNRRARTQAITIDTRILSQTAVSALKHCADSSFDILWLDPPYAAVPEQWKNLSAELFRIGSADCRLIVESDEAGAAVLAAVDANWDLTKQKFYGKIAVSFFMKKGSDA